MLTVDFIMVSHLNAVSKRIIFNHSKSDDLSFDN